MNQRPVTTLFMLASADGKISTGASDRLDFDSDLPNVKGVGDGLRQYYEIERTTDLWSLNSGKVQAKIGANEDAYPDKSAVSFVVIDNKNLTEHGVNYFCSLSKNFVLVTTNREHPAFSVKADNLHIILQDRLNLSDMLKSLKDTYGCERITVQTGGTLNGLFLREKLIDFVDFVVAPVLVGGKDTPTLIDGASLNEREELDKLGVLQLERCEVLKNSYLRIRYRAIR